MPTIHSPTLTTTQAAPKSRTRRRDPLTALENQDVRQRRDLVRAARFVANRLSGEQLHAFVEQATVLLRRFAPKEEQPHEADQPTS